MNIKELREKLNIPYANWNYANYEQFHKSPCCNEKLRMTGSINEHQAYQCMKCRKEYMLNAFTGEFLPYEKYDIIKQGHKKSVFDD